MLVADKPPIEARIFNVISRNREKWQGLRGAGQDHLELHRRYLAIRQDIISGLTQELKEKYPGEFLSDQMDHSEETFIFDTEFGVYSNSHVDTIGQQFQKIGLSARLRVVDLGSGLLEQSATAALTGARVTAYEINPYFYNSGLLLKRVFSDLPGIQALDLKQGDFMKEDLAGFDVYLVYLTDNLLGEAFMRVTEEAGRGTMLLASNSVVKPPEVWRYHPGLNAYIKQA